MIDTKHFLNRTSLPEITVQIEGIKYSPCCQHFNLCRKIYIHPSVSSPVCGQKILSHPVSPIQWPTPPDPDPMKFAAAAQAMISQVLSGAARIKPGNNNKQNQLQLLTYLWHLLQLPTHFSVDFNLGRVQVGDELCSTQQWLVVVQQPNQPSQATAPRWVLLPPSNNNNRTSAFGGGRRFAKAVRQ